MSTTGVPYSVICLLAFVGAAVLALLVGVILLLVYDGAMERRANRRHARWLREERERHQMRKHGEVA